MEPPTDRAGRRGIAPRVFIAGYYGFGNTGDEVILRTMVAHLRDLRPRLRITVTSATPEETAAAHRVASVLWCDVRALDEAIERSDLVLIGGGGLFFDTCGFDPAAFLTDQHTGIGFYTSPAVLGALHRKPVMLYGIGVGPLISESGRRFTRLACDLAHAITVRDGGSRAILASLGVAAGKVEVTADPAFGFLPRLGIELAARRAHRPRVAVAVRPFDAGDRADAWETEVVAALDAFLRRADGSVVFVPFQHLPGRREDDVVVAQRLHARMRHRDRAEILGSADPSQIHAALAQSDLIVGARLHSLILGVLARVPVVALGYDPKVGELMQRLGLGARLLDLGTLHESALDDAITRALARSRTELLPPEDEVTRSARLARRNAVVAISLLDLCTPCGHRFAADTTLVPEPFRARLLRACGAPAGIGAGEQPTHRETETSAST